MESHNRTRLTGVLTSSPLVISLLLLVVNDWYLKAAWGNWFTGKLSDFAGIFLLAILAYAILPNRKLPVAIGICLAFAWWKSPLSQSVIDSINSFGLPPVGRIVDFTDLMALSMVPLAWFAVARQEPRPRPSHAFRRVLAPPMAAACMAAMVATTPATNTEVFEVREVSRPATLDPVKVSETLRKVFDDSEMQCNECATPEKQGKFSGGSTYLSYVFLDDARIRFEVNYQPKGGRGFAGGYPGTNVREIRKALKVSLDETLGTIELRELPDRGRSYRPPPESVQAELFTEVFNAIANKNGLTRRSSGRYAFATYYLDRGQAGPTRGASARFGDFCFRFRDDVTLEYMVSPQDPRHAGASLSTKLLPDTQEALNARFSGLQFYQFDDFSVYVDFEKASLIQAAAE